MQGHPHLNSNLKSSAAIAMLTTLVGVTPLLTTLTTLASLTTFAVLVSSEAIAAPPGKPTSNSGVSASATPPAAVEDGNVSRRLRAALAESESKLGAVEPWQKKIFD